jgi:hypothetical protein
LLTFSIDFLFMFFLAISLLSVIANHRVVHGHIDATVPALSCPLNIFPQQSTVQLYLTSIHLIRMQRFSTTGGCSRR